MPAALFVVSSRASHKSKFKISRQRCRPRISLVLSLPIRERTVSVPGLPGTKHLVRQLAIRKSVDAMLVPTVPGVTTLGSNDLDL